MCPKRSCFVGIDGGTWDQAERQLTSNAALLFYRGKNQTQPRTGFWTKLLAYVFTQETEGFALQVYFNALKTSLGDQPCSNRNQRQRRENETKMEQRHSKVWRSFFLSIQGGNRIPNQLIGKVLQSLGGPPNQ